MQSKKINTNNESIDDFILSFDPCVIGPVIANLVSYVENEEFSFYVAKYKSNIYSSEIDDNNSVISNVYKAYLVNKTTNIFHSYEETSLSERVVNVLSDDIDIIVLKLESINKFSDKDIKKPFLNNVVKISPCKYDYVHNFLDFIKEYKLDNKKTDLSIKELNELVYAYVNEYKKAKVKSLKLGR